MYGVGGTSLTGTYNPGPPPITTIIAVTNNFDGTYTVQFGSSVAVGAFGIIEPNLILFDGSIPNWTQAQINAQPTADTVRIQHQLSSPSCTKLAIVGALSFITASPPITPPQEMDF